MISFLILCSGQFHGALELDPDPRNNGEAIVALGAVSNGLSSGGAPGSYMSNHGIAKRSAIAQLELYLQMRLLFVLFADGQLLSCSVSKKGLKQAESIKAEKKLGSGDAVCTSVALDQQILAVGTRRGVVELYDLAECGSPFRTVSLYDWGYVIYDIIKFTFYRSCSAMQYLSFCFFFSLVSLSFLLITKKNICFCLLNLREES